MAESKLDIQERHEGDVTVLNLKGEITLDDGDLKFRQRVHDLLDQGRTRIVLDLGAVTYIDSAGVGMLAAKLKTVQGKGGGMKLVHMTSRSQRVLGMMKILIAFETFDDEASAIKSFDWKR